MGLIRSGLTLDCAPRHDFGARVIPDASAPVIDPRTKPASLPERRNEFGVRNFSPGSRATQLGVNLDALVQQWALALSALDLRRLDNALNAIELGRPSSIGLSPRQLQRAHRCGASSRQSNNIRRYGHERAALKRAGEMAKFQGADTSLRP